jgi:histidine triad (HIT) family protein
MKDCLFCKIVAGEIPSTKVYEDEKCLAFMDIGPVVQGHALVVPKEHFANLAEATDEVAAHLICVARKIAVAQMKALGADGFNVITNQGAVAGQTVGHLHFHVIPQFEGRAHKWNWDSQPYGDLSEAAALAEKIKAAL